MVGGGGVTRPLSRDGSLRNSTETQQSGHAPRETQQSGHAPRSGPEVKNGRSSVKDGAPEKLRCGTVKEEVS